MGIKYRVNEKFFKKWGRKMSYILGYWFADGSLEDASYLRGKYIRVTSTDKATISKIKKCMNSEHTIVITEPMTRNRKTGYLLRIGDHAIYNDLIKLGLFPNKSLTVKFPRVPKKYMGDFIRGYFDGDGCVHFAKSKGKRQKIIIKRIRIIFTSGSKIFLEELNTTLKNIVKLERGAIYNCTRSFQLYYPTSDSVKLFKFMYKNISSDLYLKRKLKIFMEYFKLRQPKINDSFKNLLNDGHVVK